MLPQQPRINIGSKGIDVVQHQVLKLWSIVQHFLQHTVTQHVREFVPVPDRVQTLRRQVITIVAAFSHAASPTDQRRPQTLSHLFLLFIQFLLRHLAPRKLQVASHWDHSQADIATGRQSNVGIRIAIIFHLLQLIKDRPVSHVPGCDHMRNCGPKR